MLFFYAPEGIRKGTGSFSAKVIPFSSLFHKLYKDKRQVKWMPFSVNVFNLKVNSIASNGSLNLGPVIHNSHSARSKSFGSNSSVGDQSPTKALMSNHIKDPDFIDQSDVQTKDNAYATQS